MGGGMAEEDGKEQQFQMDSFNFVFEKKRGKVLT